MRAWDEKCEWGRPQTCEGVSCVVSLGRPEGWLCRSRPTALSHCSADFEVGFAPFW